MHEVANFPCRVREIETTWIPLSDGIQLAARLWLPEMEGNTPVPAVLEYLPYRHGDGTAIIDSINYGYLAGHGIAGVRVDVRGTGNSEGLILDEYSEAELDDAAEVIAWIAEQACCSGKIGMWGYSWGGINALQVAARRPPALKAIMTLYSADDRFGEDCHFMGGCLLDENLEWGNEFLSNCTRPPDPAVVGERWRAMWHERLDALDLAMDPWLRHQSRDDYWRRASVSEDYVAIEAAVYAVGGWTDGYSNTVLRLMEKLPGPRKALIGPWGHDWPHVAEPGPQIGFLQEAMRWWNHWLCNEDTGIMDEPMVRVWMQDSIPPSSTVREWPGRWIAASSWPDIRITNRTLPLAASGNEQTHQDALLLTHPQTVGIKASKWCPYGLGTDMADDQRADDALSLSFMTPALEEPLEIFGAPVVHLDLAVDRPRAFLAVRLCDVAPDGQTTRVSYTLLNLVQPDENGHPVLLEPGCRFSVTLRLNDTAYAFPAGHRLRVAVSTAYWPMVWPSPDPVTLNLFADGTTLELPVRPVDEPLDQSLVPFGPPEGAPQLDNEVLAEGEQSRRFEHDLTSGEMRMVMEWGKGAVRFSRSGLLYDFRGAITNRIREQDPTSSVIETRMDQVLARDDWDTRTEINTTLACSRDDFTLTATVDAYEGGKHIFNRHWNRVIPRSFL